MGGRVFRRDLDGWSVSWESAGAYRHWCVQEKPAHRRRVMLVLKNPGSLSDDGTQLRRDTTLRILRHVGETAGIDWLIVNLFDFAAPNPRDLHANWARRDAQALVFGRLPLGEEECLMFAHGDFGPDRARAYRRRIALIRGLFASLREIRIPQTKAGNGLHPINWQRMRLIPSVTKAIAAAAGS